jgi:hypothetical protein
MAKWKTALSSLKASNKFETKKLDFSSSKVKKEVKQVREAQEKILDRKNVEIDKLKVVIQL